MLDFASKMDFGYDSIDEAFPPVDPGQRPLADRIIVQIRSPKKRTAGGIIIPEEALETEHWNTQVAKVVALGPLCFRDQQTLELWKEGAWFELGDFVRVPKYGGDKWPVRHEDGAVVFVSLRARDVLGVITGDPLSVRAFF